MINANRTVQTRRWPAPTCAAPLDERSMRILELGLAGMALVAAILLAVIR